MHGIQASKAFAAHPDFLPVGRLICLIAETAPKFDFEVFVFSVNSFALTKRVWAEFDILYAIN